MCHGQLRISRINKKIFTFAADGPHMALAWYEGERMAPECRNLKIKKARE